jgi:hypothetical protein
MAEPNRNQNQERGSQSQNTPPAQNQDGQNWGQNPGQQSGGKDGRPAPTATRKAGDQSQANDENENRSSNG